MQLRKIAILGAVALVVIGCVLAAGCTSTVTDTAAAEDQIVGSWIDEEGSAAFFVTGDGKGAYYKVIDNEIVEDSSLVWTKNSDGTYAFTNPEERATVNVTLDTVKGTFTSESGFTFFKRASSTSGANDIELWKKSKDSGYFISF